LAGREDALRPKETPDDGGAEECFGGWTGEVRLLPDGAHVLDTGESEVEDQNLHKAGNGGRCNLGREHGSRWDLHIVAAEKGLAALRNRGWHHLQLQVAHKSKRLRSGNVTVRFEHH